VPAAAADFGHPGALVTRLGERVGGHLGRAGVTELLEIKARRAPCRADALRDHDVEGPAHGPALADLERRAASQQLARRRVERVLHHGHDGVPAFSRDTALAGYRAD
jgi:hypothetical protein